MKRRHLKGKGQIVYDFKFDILTFKMKERDYAKSVEFQNFVADIDKEGFVTGVRIFDASKVFRIEKYVLSNIVQSEFNASIENNVITIVLRFVGRKRNRLIPLIQHDENFTQQFTTPLGGKLHLLDSSVECPMEA